MYKIKTIFVWNYIQKYIFLMGLLKRMTTSKNSSINKRFPGKENNAYLLNTHCNDYKEN